MQTFASVVTSPIILVLLVALPSTATAQTTSLHPGDEVRVRWQLTSDRSYGFPVQRSAVGELVDRSETHILLRRDGRFFSVPVATVRSLERRVGTKPTSAPAMVMGSGIGFAAGLTTGLLVGSLDRTAHDGDRLNRGISTGVLLGAPLGALVVYVASRSRGIYESVPLTQVRPTFAVSPSGRFGASLSVAAW